ncbi:MAG: sensor of ECF-type sigma factor [Flavobacteriaceae bacterium]|jgi:hypothetical protein|nr:sensor of ECF-type sigma factor [Flavobacteriaceae bacterium]
MKTIIPFLVFFLSAFTIYAQPSKEKKEQIKSLKTAFITTELELTPAEAEKFWPIYNTFEEKQFNLRAKSMKFFRGQSDSANITEKEAIEILAQMEILEEETHQLKKRFIQDLKVVISPVKIIKLKKAEEDFNRKLLRQYKGGHDKRK